MTLALLVFLPASATSTPGQTVHWPQAGDLVPRDAIVYVYAPSAGYGPPLLGPDGADVPYDVVPLDGVWEALVPRADLAPGEHRVEALGGSVTFTVEDRLAEVAPPPIPYRRWQNASCFGGGPSLGYHLCGGGIAHLIAFGAEPPVEPELGAFGRAYVAGVGGPGLVTFPSTERPLTVWLGALDEAGRFGGWVRDVVDGPLPDGMVREAPAGVDPFGTTTPDTCAPFTGWEQLETDERDCSTSYGEEEQPLADDAGCGCRTGGGPGLGGIVLLLLRRGRGSGTTAERQPALRRRDRGVRPPRPAVSSRTWCR